MIARVEHAEEESARAEPSSARPHPKGKSTAWQHLVAKKREDNLYTSPYGLSPPLFFPRFYFVSSPGNQEECNTEETPAHPSCRQLRGEMKREAQVQSIPEKIDPSATPFCAKRTWWEGGALPGGPVTSST